jgi:hypothetical protein
MRQPFGRICLVVYLECIKYIRAFDWRLTFLMQCLFHIQDAVLHFETNKNEIHDRR